MLPHVHRIEGLKNGNGDKKIQAYNYRVCLTTDPKNRIPIEKPEGYREIDHELLLRNFDAGDMRLPALVEPLAGGLKVDWNNNGIETSPVVRGVFVLENILGTPPLPPPVDVPAIDPDVRGAKSVRELLSKHRESPNCYSCHSKIDPLGFALENFDPVEAVVLSELFLNH
jgi:hypothetical protein